MCVVQVWSSRERRTWIWLPGFRSFWSSWMRNNTSWNRVQNTRTSVWSSVCSYDICRPRSNRCVCFISILLTLVLTLRALQYLFLWHSGNEAWALLQSKILTDAIRPVYECQANCFYPLSARTHAHKLISRLALSVRGCTLQSFISARSLYVRKRLDGATCVQYCGAKKPGSYSQTAH